MLKIACGFGTLQFVRLVLCGLFGPSLAVGLEELGATSPSLGADGSALAELRLCEWRTDDDEDLAA